MLALQEKAREKFGRPARRVKARLRKVKGGMSGGTAASAQATLAAAARDPSLIQLLTDPFALTPVVVTRILRLLTILQSVAKS